MTIVDLGLHTGVKVMWEQDVLHDFILQVEDREFRVHRVVLAATSQFFWAMFGQGFMESSKERVDLQGQQADVVCRLLQFVYTGEEAAIGGHEAEVLHCFMYLQMPLLSQFCVNKLLADLTLNNCQTLLSTLTDYSFHEAVHEVKTFIRANWKTLILDTKPEDMSLGTLELVVECWDMVEWDLFLCIEGWLSVDGENRQGHVNQLMSKVRFCLIDPAHIKAIINKDIFSQAKGSWQDLVRNALKFHQMSINLKVLDKSEQTRLKTKPSPIFFTVGQHEPASNFYVLDEENRWKKLKNKMLNMPSFKHCQTPLVVEVNNYFVVCTTCDADQKWFVFDPRTLTWSQIAGMPKPRRKFALVHHDKHLYVLGGQYVPNYRDSCTDVQRYSFLTNTWRAYGHLPYSVTKHAACALGHNLYCSGGDIDNNRESDRLVSLDLSSPQHKLWEDKAASQDELANHKMCAMTIQHEEVLVVIDQRFEVSYYSPSRDQWSQFDVTVPLPLDIPDFFLDEMLLVGHNSVFMLNFDGLQFARSGFGQKQHGVCWEWRIPENTIEAIAECPVSFQRDSGPRVCPFGAVLALPAGID